MPDPGPRRLNNSVATSLQAQAELLIDRIDKKILPKPTNRLPNCEIDQTARSDHSRHFFVRGSHERLDPVVRLGADNRSHFTEGATQPRILKCGEQAG